MSHCPDLNIALIIAYKNNHKLLPVQTLESNSACTRGRHGSPPRNLETGGP